jgi:hypothetical protein
VDDLIVFSISFAVHLKHVIADGAKEFKAKVLKRIAVRAGIEQKFSTSY